MKYLIVLLVILVMVWLWRSGRNAAKQSQRDVGAKQGPTPRLEMVRCAVCGLHLPESEAVRANASYYCSVEHLNQDPEAPR